MTLRGTFPLDEFSGLRTPFYYYDLDLLRQTMDELKAIGRRNPSFQIHYAIKANSNPTLLRELADAGFGADCVSGGEIRAALAAGFQPEGIVFAGVGKSDEEIRLGLQSRIARFNVESEAELRVISEQAQSMAATAPVSLRVNPDIGAHTHANITTGLSENKFGINMEQLEDVLRLSLTLPGIAYKGLHFHIGSQITDMTDFQALCNRINDLSASLRRHGLPVGDINVGGGLGINTSTRTTFPWPTSRATSTPSATICSWSPDRPSTSSSAAASWPLAAPSSAGCCT